MKFSRFLVPLLALLAGTSCEYGQLTEAQPTCEDMQVACEQFVEVHFHYGFKNELDTFELTYQKDLVGDGVISTDFWFTTDEQEELLAKVEQYNFYLLPDTIKQREHVIVKPDAGWQFLRIKQGDRNHTVSWYNLVSWYYPQPEYEEYIPDLRALHDYITELIESKCAYQLLPPARGGYV
ncbi:hypothetical protein ACFL4K_00635 [Candidatus Neomarinimicrobiota bacterium]